MDSSTRQLPRMSTMSQVALPCSTTMTSPGTSLLEDTALHTLQSLYMGLSAFQMPNARPVQGRARPKGAPFTTQLQVESYSLQADSKRAVLKCVEVTMHEQTEPIGPKHWNLSTGNIWLDGWVVDGCADELMSEPASRRASE